MKLGDVLIRNVMAPRGGGNEKFWRGEMTAAMPVARRASGWNEV